MAKGKTYRIVDGKLVQVGKGRKRKKKESKTKRNVRGIGDWAFSSKPFSASKSQKVINKRLRSKKKAEKGSLAERFGKTKKKAKSYF